MPPEDVVSVAEIAATLGVSKRSAARYVDRPDFPKPLATLATGRVWHRRQVERWAERTLPLKPGRPRKPAGRRRKEP